MNDSRVPIFLALLTAVLLTGCAAQNDGRPGEAEGDEGTEETAAADIPARPPECESDADCTTSVYTQRVGSVEDCYCTGCPEPISAAAADANRHGWNLHCRGWQDERDCIVPMCTPPPGEAGCPEEGRCGWRIDEGQVGEP